MSMFLPLPVCVEVFVSVMSCKINTESVLNLRTTCDERCSVQCMCCTWVTDDCHSSGMLRQQYDTSAVVSARDHGFYTVPYSYEFFLQGDVLRTVSTRQNKEYLTGDYSLADSSYTSERATLGKTLAGVLQMTVSTNCAGSR